LERQERHPYCLRAARHGRSSGKRQLLSRAAFAFAAAFSLVLVLLTIASPAVACPNCAAGAQARSDVWNDDFGLNLALAALPFLVIVGLCISAEAIGRRRAPDRVSELAKHELSHERVGQPLRHTSHER
jgi:ABC-type Fe3+ transport system permease subunit